VTKLAPNSACALLLLLLGFGANVSSADPNQKAAEAVRSGQRPEGSTEAARDTVAGMLRRILSPADTAIHLSREAVIFKYAYARATAAAWAFHIQVTDTSRCPDAALEKALRASGWVENYGYMGDGPDSRVVGLTRSNSLVVIEAEWDGTDDSDSTYVPAPGCHVTVTCAPQREDDVYPR